MDDTYDVRWLRVVLKESIISDDFDLVTAAANGPGRTRPLDPSQLAYLGRLIGAIKEGRAIAGTYNFVLLGVLLVFTAWHWADKLRLSRRSAAKREHFAPGVTDHDSNGDAVTSSRAVPTSGGASSSSSSTLQGTWTPPNLIKAKGDLDVERLPLLPSSESKRGPRKSSRIVSVVSSWLTYQPRPLPIVNRTLPSNGTTLFVLAYLGLNIFYQFYRVPLHPKHFFVFADRAALVFVANLPLLYLLAAKNHPLQHLTGHSYESLNIFHRRVGELLCLEAFVHSAGMVLFQACFAPDWLIPVSVWEFLSHRLALLGIGALVSYELLYLTSLGSFRRRWYELFLASHVVLQAAALIFLWLHFPTSRPYVYAALGIFVLDRLVWRLCLRSTRVDLDLHVLPDGDTVMLSANWDVPSPKPGQNRFFSHSLSRMRKSIIAGWEPTDHVFLTIPSLGRVHSLQAHPFTIASAAPLPDAPADADAHSELVHAWLNLLVRAQSGFTTDLLHYALRHKSVAARLDGPYGSTRAMDTLRSADRAVLVAGGSGIAVAFPIAWALLMEQRRRIGGSGQNADGSPPRLKGESEAKGRRGQISTPRVRLLWIIHSEEHRFWVPSHMMDELEALGLDLVISPPTAVAGRPDVASLVGGWIRDDDGDGAPGKQVGVMVSGPDGLNRLVRNTCARCLGEGSDVRLVVEKFGW